MSFPHRAAAAVAPLSDVLPFPPRADCRGCSPRILHAGKAETLLRSDVRQNAGDLARVPALWQGAATAQSGPRAVYYGLFLAEIPWRMNRPTRPSVNRYDRHVGNLSREGREYRSQVLSLRGAGQPASFRSTPGPTGPLSPGYWSAQSQEPRGQALLAGKIYLPTCLSEVPCAFAG